MGDPTRDSRRARDGCVGVLIAGWWRGWWVAGWLVAEELGPTLLPRRGSVPALASVLSSTTFIPFATTHHIDMLVRKLELSSSALLACKFIDCCIPTSRTSHRVGRTTKQSSTNNRSASPAHNHSISFEPIVFNLLVNVVKSKVYLKTSKSKITAELNRPG